MTDFVESAYRENPDNGFRIAQQVIDWAKKRRDEETRLQALLQIARIYFCKGKSDSLQQYLYMVETQAGSPAYNAVYPLIQLEWFQYNSLIRNWEAAMKSLRKGMRVASVMPASVRKSEMTIKLMSKISVYFDVAEVDKRGYKGIDSMCKYGGLVHAELQHIPDSAKLLPHYYLMYVRTNLYTEPPSVKVEYLNRVVAAFKANNNYVNLVQCYQDLSFAYQEQSKQKAIAYIDSAIHYALILNTNYHKWAYYEHKLRLLKEDGQFEQGCIWCDSLNRVSRLMFSNQISERLAVAEKKFESAALRARNAEAEAEIARSGRFIYGIIAGFIFIIGALGFAFYRHNIKQLALTAEAKRRTELADQRRIITEQLNRQISAERTEVNALLEEMLVRDKQNIPLNGLRNAVQSYLTGNTSRDQRRQKFTELYPDFFVNLLMQHPGLTPSEQDIAMFVTEGTSNTDMTEIFSWVNTDSAANRKSKLKVKLGFSSLPDLERYLSALK
ncbi:MAG: hypothetical protein V4543_03215 [Bacteroidota bacterium]